MYALIACTDALVDEVVLGVDVPAFFTLGDEGARLGDSVAGDPGAWLATAPGAQRVWADGAETADSGVAVGFSAGERVRVDAAGTVVRGGVELGVVAGARAWAIGDAGIVAATPDGLEWVDRVVGWSGVQALAWGTDRLLGVVCDADCVAFAWDAGGNAIGELAPAGEGGAVGEWEGMAWAGDPAEEDGAPGRVCSEEGKCIEGLPGDRLGSAIGGGYAAGVFNGDIVPARARIVPLDDGPVYALEQGGEGQGHALSGTDGLLVGVPYHPAHGVPSGAVIEVEH